MRTGARCWGLYALSMGWSEEASQRKRQPAPREHCDEGASLDGGEVRLGRSTLSAGLRSPG